MSLSLSFKQRIALLFVCLFLLTVQISGCTRLSNDMEAPKQPAIEFITAEALAELTADQNQLTATHLILDVRTAEEYATGHIPSAINIDYRDISAQIKARSETLQAFKTKKVVVYCERGVRAGRAEAALTAAGFQVIRLKGDIRAWKAAGLPIQR